MTLVWHYHPLVDEAGPGIGIGPTPDETRQAVEEAARRAREAIAGAGERVRTAPGEAANAAANAVKSAVGETTQQVFAALLGPALEALLSVVLAGAGLVMVGWAVLHLARTTGASDKVREVSASSRARASKAQAPLKNLTK